MAIFSHLFEHKNIHTLNLFRLFFLRFFLIGIAFIFIIVASLNHFSLPYTQLIYVLMFLLSINILTGWWLFKDKPVNDKSLILQLIIDVAAFTAILYFTGGASNPFGWFYLVPIFIAATLLPGKSIWLITTLSMLGYTGLMFFYIPLASNTPSQHIHMQQNTGFHQHVIGMWLGYMLTAFLVAYIISRMANSLRERDRSLAKAREKALRDERLVALGTLAAGTAHELGTPLSTISIITKEMQNLTHSEESIEYLGIIREQIERCKLTLSSLSQSAGKEMMQGGKLLPVKKYIHDVISQWKQQRPDTQLIFSESLGLNNIHILTEQTLTQALINILNNAADASPDKILFNIEQKNSNAILHIIDDGPGINPTAHTYAGKKNYSNKNQQQEVNLGLGLFLSHATIERLGGEIHLENQPKGGAMVTIILPLTQTTDYPDYGIIT